ncbi:MAG TPA: hypothetical protein VFO38_03050 [Candidatus Saccharimonadales bacterium]|nr:hypothetical protein [Candidatus Saccharimonadales bacterium]
MRKAVLVVPVLLLALVAACGSADNAPAPTTPSSTAQTTPTVKRGDSAAGMAYLQSSERNAAYLKMWPAAEKVAKLILDGKLGAFSMNAQNGDKVGPDYAGWARLCANNKAGAVEAYADVWWENGKPDFAKGVTGFRLLDVEMSKKPEDTYYKMDHNQIDYHDVMSPDYFGGVSPTFPNRHPTSEQQAKVWDKQAIDYVESLLRTYGV